MMQPEEIEVKYILPVIRKQLCIGFKKKGLSQKYISEILGITPAAVSQYLKSKRATKIELPKQINSKIEKICDKEDITAEKIAIEIRKLSKQIKNKKILCKIHKKYDLSIEKGCIFCEECLK